MSDEDDYLSDKFLLESSSSAAAPKTYSQTRKQALKQQRLKNEQNRQISQRQRELEAREEGLSKSLFARAKEEEAAGVGSGNKALSIMMKMGFKPGESLGKTDDGEPSTFQIPPVQPESSTSADTTPTPQDSTALVPKTPKESTSQHKTEPLPINEWAGKRGIGLGKRARSPTTVERVAKMAKMAEDATHLNFRDRARQVYEERRAEGRLGPAQRTCVTLDEKAQKTFNVLWLNPMDPTSFPPGLLDALALHTNLVIPASSSRVGDTIETRLRRQIQAEALQPISSDDLIGDDTIPTTDRNVDFELSSDILEEATQFLRLQAQDRLELILSYLREQYAYCFWCGTQYDNSDDMSTHCPGTDEEDHD